MTDDRRTKQPNIHFLLDEKGAESMTVFARLRTAVHACHVQCQRGDIAPTPTSAVAGVVPQWRGKVVQWLQTICIDSCDVVATRTVALAVSLVDAYLWKRCVERNGRTLSGREYVLIAPPCCCCLGRRQKLDELPRQ